MKKVIRLPIALVILVSIPLIYNNCGGFMAAQVSSRAIPFSRPLALSGTEANVLPVSVGTCGYVNEPCVSVTVCSPGATLGSSSCATVDNVLLDTGSFGLRLFADQIPSTVALSAQRDPASGNPLAECVQYDSDMSNWGPVVLADAYLGNGYEKAANVPIQLINASYGAVPSTCPSPATYSLASGNANSPGYNGILGVGLLTDDCGPGCASDANNGVYYACAGATCAGAAASESLQVTNPVALLATDNNGVILQLPSIPAAGAAAVSGYLILGIGTRADNSPPAGTTMFQADSLSNFETQYAGQLIGDVTASSDGAFIDSGSVALAFGDTSITQCADAANQGFYCPATTESLSAEMMGISGAPQDAIPFQVANADNLSTANGAFNNMAAYLPSAFDWGLPFFFGKTVYVGLQNTSSPLGTGPYWAF
jgi:hypothetical protein